MLRNINKLMLLITLYNLISLLSDTFYKCIFYFKFVN